MLPTLKACDGALIHEVIPTSDGKAGDVHFREMSGAILRLPILIVVWVFEPFIEQSIVVSVRYRQRFWIAGNALDPFWVNLHFRFQSHRIASIDVDYDTLAVSKFLFNMRSDESLK